MLFSSLAVPVSLGKLWLEAACRPEASGVSHLQWDPIVLSFLLPGHILT